MRKRDLETARYIQEAAAHQIRSYRALTVGTVVEGGLGQAPNLEVEDGILEEVPNARRQRADWAENTPLVVVLPDGDLSAPAVLGRSPYVTGQMADTYAP